VPHRPHRSDDDFVPLGQRRLLRGVSHVGAQTFGLDASIIRQRRDRRVEDLRHHFLHAAPMLAGIGPRLFVAVIGEDPHIVVAPRRPLRRLPDSGDRAVDAFERPVRESRRWAATMTLFVVADEIEIDDRQPPRDVHLGSDGGQLAHQDAHADAGRNELDLPPKVATSDEPAQAIQQRQKELHHEEHAGAKHAVEVQQHQQGHAQRMAESEQVAPGHGGGAQMALGSAPGIDGGIGTASGEQRPALPLQTLFDLPGGIGLEHPTDAAGRAVEEAERRNRPLDAVQQLGRHRRRARRQAAVQRVETVLVPVHQLPQKGQIPPGHRPLQLPTAEPVDLDQHKPPRRGHILRLRQPQQPDQQLATAEPMSRPPDERFHEIQHAISRDRRRASTGRSDWPLRRCS